MFGQMGQGQGFGLGQQLPGIGQQEQQGAMTPMAAGMMGQGAQGMGQGGMAGLLAQLGPLLAQMQGQQQQPQQMPGQLPVAGQGMQGQGMGLPAMSALQRGYMAQGGGIAPQRQVVGG